MPARGFAPGIVHSFLGRASPALHNANLGDRPPGCPHSARLKFSARAGKGLRPCEGPSPPVAVRQAQLFSTDAFSTVTAFFGAPSPAPPSTPASPTFSTAFSEASSIVPNGV